jgi:hypothetical protein
MQRPLSSEAALTQVKYYTGLDLSADDIMSLYEILTVPRKDTAIFKYLRKAKHPLGVELEHLPEGENWWDKVRNDIVKADDDPYPEEAAGSRQHHVAHDRKAATWWLDHWILPALTGEGSTSKGVPGAGIQGESKGVGQPAPAESTTSGQGSLTDAKKRRALDNYAMVAAIDYYKKEWYVEDVHKTKGVLDLLLTHRVSGEVLRVEVKGSSKEAETVEVTRWEVERSRKEACELFVLDKIQYQDTGQGPDDYTCQGGRRRRRQWCAEDKDLTAKTYDYALGADFA